MFKFRNFLKTTLLMLLIFGCGVEEIGRFSNVHQNHVDVCVFSNREQNHREMIQTKNHSGIDLGMAD